MKNLKQEIEEILDFLKSKGHTRRIIEQELGYEAKSLDQLVSKGGNQKLLTLLKFYKKYVLNISINLNDPQGEKLKTAISEAKKQLEIAEKALILNSGETYPTSPDDKTKDELSSGIQEDILPDNSVTSGQSIGSSKRKDKI